MTDRPTYAFAVPATLAVAVATIFMLTAARTVVFIDSGEFSTVAWTLGIPHPTGYPLYTMLSWIAAHLPLPAEPVFMLNLLSSAFSVAAVVLMYGFLHNLVLTRLAAPAKPTPATRNRGFAPAAGACFGAATLAFSGTFWSGSTAAEVYPLHALFLVVLCRLFVGAFMPEGTIRGARAVPEGRKAVLFAFTVGLSFTNHLSTLYLAPALLFTYFRIHGTSRWSVRTLVRLTPAFLLGLTPYLFLPIRASSAPIMNWGNTVGWEAIIRHLSGRQYSVWIFSSAGTAVRQLGYFFSHLGAEFFYLPLACALWGMKVLFTRDRTLFYFFLLLFAGCLFFAVNYDINDIDSYFLLAYTAVAAAAGIGAYSLFSSFSRTIRKVAVAVAILFLALQVTMRFPEVDQSDLRVVEQYTRSILGSVEEGSVVLSYQWDYFVSASYYLQIVEGFRPDVVVVDKELLRRSWYLGYLRQRFPRIMERAEGAAAAYLTELRKFENSLPYDPAVIEAKYARFIAALLGAGEAGHSYVTAEIEPQYTSGYLRIPHGLTFRLVRPGNDPEWKEVPVVIDSPPPVNRYITGITMLAARAELNNALYLEREGRNPEAEKAARRALSIRPDLGEAGTLLGRLGK